MQSPFRGRGPGGGHEMLELPIFRRNGVMFIARPRFWGDATDAACVAKLRYRRYADLAVNTNFLILQPCSRVSSVVKRISVKMDIAVFFYS